MSNKRSYYKINPKEEEDSDIELKPWQECTSEDDLLEDEDTDPMEEKLDELLDELNELKKQLKELMLTLKPNSLIG